jgi:proline dehydrogenase
MIDRLFRAVFHTLGSTQTLKRIASRYGMRSPGGFARRFIAGETIEEAIEAARILEATRMMQTLDYLGESVASIVEADQATRTYLGIIESIAKAGIGRNISLKLTQLGLTIDRATCVDNLRRLLDASASHGFFVRVDMENSPFTQVTLDIFETIWQQGYRNAGIVLQSYLPRSLADAKRMNELGARVRLVKGAYNEPAGVAFQDKAQVDQAFVEIMKVLLSGPNYPAIATHHPAMIAATRDFAAAHNIPTAAYEFQMLYGVRRDLQKSLTEEGFRVRVYVPFGREWFPYFMRRLGERPANIGFVIRSLAREG